MELQSLKPVHGILANISEDKGSVNYITPECLTEIIIKIPFIPQIKPIK
jgi:hypothetical protein